jgi:predicted enzyme related to lactoylglutathione lyase
MFEIIANDQEAMKTFYSKVFGWHYQLGEGAFAYVHFGPRTLPLLGGIGAAKPNIPGFEPGHHFYIRVASLEATIERAVLAGGKTFVPPTKVDGYDFAMIKDPEGNAIGLIEPFSL